MGELNKKLHYKKDETTDEITLYSTLEEVNNKGLNLKVDGVNCYAGYGNIGDLSRMYCKTNEQSYKILKKTEHVNIILKAYRNNEEFMQNLPSVGVVAGQRFHLKNDNAPTIEAFDFVCCSENNFKVTADMEGKVIKVYYIPQFIADRNRNDFTSYYLGNGGMGDLSHSDKVNTYNAKNTTSMFSYCDASKLPKMNLSNVTIANSMFMGTFLKDNVDLKWMDTSQMYDVQLMFSKLSKVTSLDCPNANFSNVGNYAGMLQNCSKLERFTGILDFKNIKSNVSIQDIFTGCPKLKNVHIINVPRNIDKSVLGGVEGETYIIDSYRN